MDIEQNDTSVAEDSIRGDLERAFAAAEADTAPDSAPESPAEPSPTPAPEPVTTNPRDEKGKFQKASPEPAPEPVAVVAKPAPKSWKAEEKALWDKTPAEIRAIIERREAEVEKGFTALDEDRNFGKSMKETIAPYMAIIQAEGGTPVTAVQSLLNTAYYLRSNATPQEKGAMIRGLAKQFNADLTETTPTAVQPNDALAATQRELAELRQTIQKQPEIFKQEQEKALIDRTISAFAADPKNVHYEKLRPAMASLLSGGQATDMQDAYDKARWVDPEIRPLMLAEQQKASEAKRIADAQAKTVIAKKTAVSVKGSPGIVPMTNGKANGSIADDLRAAMEEHGFN